MREPSPLPSPEKSFRAAQITHNGPVQVRFLVGPAGSGKTFRCLSEIRDQLAGASDGLPLVLVAPKQTTYELERQLLADALVPGYTRLHVLSFERLADFVFDQLGMTPPELLTEEGRVMVLRGLLARKRKGLRLFRASARLAGFAQQLSSTIAEFQQSRLTPESLREIAGRTSRGTVSLKLQDLAALMQEYLEWLAAHGLQDRERLLGAAAEALDASRNAPDCGKPGSRVLHLRLYIDGFAELAETEVELVAALLPFCAEATLTFCLSETAPPAESWLSGWSVAHRTMEYCRKRLAAVPGTELVLEHLARDPHKSRFRDSRALEHLERHWADGEPASPAAPLHADGPTTTERAEKDLRVVQCADPEAEVTLAAREILAFVRRGGRFRESAVLVRDLESYHQTFQRIFSRYEIPFFLDRRQSVGHHPLAELTRSALRSVALGWQHDDWFAVLKTGLVPAREEEIDRLENEALARGWQGTAWQRQLRILETGRTEQDRKRLQQLEEELERLRRRLIRPFERLALTLRQAHNKPTGVELATSIRELWAELNAGDQLQRWASVASPANSPEPTGAHHETVWNEINGWLENIELAFANDPLPIREWLPVLEAGLANLTIGLIPPALDQVLIGSADRSRNPDIKLGFVLGMNEGVFPASPASAMLLTVADRAELEQHGLRLGLSSRQQMSRERYYAYIACTRPRQKLVLTFAEKDADGAILNPSPFLLTIRQIFPGLDVELAPQQLDWRDCQHPHELFGHVAGLRKAGMAA
ncbi:MAG TPA: hypothetical protein VJA21_32665, partial [Verrucomicrobiae bacterium]